MDERDLIIVRRELGSRIRRLRLEQHYSLRSFALMIDVDHAYLSRSERGEKNVNIDFLLKVSKGLNIELYELFLPEEQFACLETKLAHRSN